MQAPPCAHQPLQLKFLLGASVRLDAHHLLVEHLAVIEAGVPFKITCLVERVDGHCELGWRHTVPDPDPDAIGEYHRVRHFRVVEFQELRKERFGYRILNLQLWFEDNRRRSPSIRAVRRRSVTTNPRGVRTPGFRGRFNQNRKQIQRIHPHSVRRGEAAKVVTEVHLALAGRDCVLKWRRVTHGSNRFRAVELRCWKRPVFGGLVDQAVGVDVPTPGQHEHRHTSENGSFHVLFPRSHNHVHGQNPISRVPRGTR